MLAHAAAMRAASFLRARPSDPPAGQGHEILLTGTFYSDNWIASHLRPLAASAACARVRMVSVRPLPGIHKVEVVRPPRLLVVLAGEVPARLVCFVWTALRRRPHVVGGFHLLVNGLVAALVGRLIGARSLYFCVGGAMEVVDGGIRAENRLFGKMETADPVIEERLVRAVGQFDIVVTMGSNTIHYFRGRGVEGVFHAIPGGIDGRRFRPSAAPVSADLVLVGRLEPIKRVDLFLRAVARVAARLPEVKAVVVGEGSLRASLEQLAVELGIGGHTSFVGRRSDVEALLNSARLFVLTSDSEGLPLSVMEAMMCGLPAVASRVGDLSDLVEHGVNGYLVEKRTPEAFAEPILELLLDPGRRARFSEAARRSAEKHDISAVSRRWDSVLGARRKRPSLQ
jgi:glycosyltransferase involved in cell wall biosynthesis